ncbi:MAG TPA: thiamine pyrophosphate-dependent enzyme, partial [Bryobacteraceae bacterium]|nr:thiamine pyrophosphate-dependent enzyme [Bryobacteraceae bacterium]
YAILKAELASAAANPGRRSLDMLEIGRPDIDWVSLARSLGVPGCRVSSLEQFAAALRHGFESEGPNLVEVPL